MPTLTESVVRSARPRARKYEVTCSSVQGLVLRVLPSGRKVFFLRYRDGDRDVRERLGAVEEVSLAEARAQAQARLLTEAPPLRVAPRPRVGPRVRELAARYFDEHVAVHLKPGTRVAYRAHLRRILAEFGDDRLVDVTPERVERWHASLRTTPCAANNSLRVLSHMFTKASEWRLVPRDHGRPTATVRLYRERQRERFLTPEERARLDEVLRAGERAPTGKPGAISWSVAAAIRLLALTGMRRGEVLALEWSMVDRRHRCFRLPDSKTGQKSVPIGTPVLELLDALERRRRPGVAYVVHSSRGTRLLPGTLGRAWAQLRRRAGLDDVRIHDLRHSAASDAIMSGVPLAVVGKILGHATPRTTARYAHISDAALADAVEAMSTSIAACGRTRRAKGSRR
ncbi:MAG: tyrosine-type recombinase/integrase [Myxococcales bacterium]|nr:tyrosine-type recombinase/integrase [Myxococcales bacterium]